MQKPLIAIVGRPNVGKSNLFNRLVQRKIAIVEDVPGVTRDRLYGQVNWSGREFILIDTGGIVKNNTDVIQSQVLMQAKMAMEEAEVILFVVDGQEGLQPGDEDIAKLLRHTRKPILVAVNKIDNLAMESHVWEFHALGLSPIIAVSAIHGHNTGDLLDELVSLLPPLEDGGEDKGDYTAVAVVGKPNVGKSSLVNLLLGQERVIVSAEPGTTRDAIDTYIQREGRGYQLIDTAGLRRPARVAQPTERYSVFRALRAIERSDVVLLLVDATSGVTEQDKRIGGYIHDAGPGLIIAINKWDLITKDQRTQLEYEEEVRYQLSFLSYAPLLFISARTGRGVQRLFPLIDTVANNRKISIPTAHLNSILTEAVNLRPPSARRGRVGKIFYATQTSYSPPVFLLFVNDPHLFHFSYLRYLENKLREGYDFTGTPLRLRLRKRP